MVVAIASQFILPEGHTFFLKEDIFYNNGDTFEIKDEHNNLWFTVKDNPVDPLDHTLRDAQGNTVAKIRNKGSGITDTLHHSMVIEDNAGQVIAIVEKKKMFAIAGSDAVVYFSDHHKKTPDLKIHGDFLSHDFEIKDEAGTVMAKISEHELSVANLVSHKHRFAVHVSAHVDSSLMVAIAITLDEIFHEKEHHHPKH